MLLLLLFGTRWALSIEHHTSMILSIKFEKRKNSDPSLLQFVLPSWIFCASRWFSLIFFRFSCSNALKWRSQRIHIEIHSKERKKSKKSLEIDLLVYVFLVFFVVVVVKVEISILKQKWTIFWKDTACRMPSIWTEPSEFFLSFLVHCFYTFTAFDFFVLLHFHP